MEPGGRANKRNEKKATTTNEPAIALETSFRLQERAIREISVVLKNNKGLTESPRRKLNAIGSGNRNGRRSMKKRTMRCISIQVDINDYHSRVIVLEI